MRSDLRVVAAGRGREGGTAPARGSSHGVNSSVRVETDGRGFSIARLLRSRYGYRGELRAVGEVTRDHLYYMEKCGFNAFELRAGEDAAEALAAFDDFSESYQAKAARPVPLFRRRA